MPKFRVIPTVLTDGSSQVKGENFNNWRVVGSIMQAVKVHARREVDEILLLDVTAGNFGGFISPKLVAHISRTLRIPLAVGGGISRREHIEELLNAGADKVVLGTASLRQDGFVRDVASVFGSQAIVCSVDSKDSAHEGVAYRSGKEVAAETPVDLALRLERDGAGELLVQSVERDGRMMGMDFPLIDKITSAVRVPVIASSGASSGEDFFQAFACGASAAAAGALFQFTEMTPNTVKDYLKSRGVNVRI